MSASPSLLPPSDGNFGFPSPSGLTPFTRSEAENAFTYNSTQQTDSAAPDPSLHQAMDTTSDDTRPEALQAYRRPVVARASSMNYELALKRAKQSSVSSNMSTDSTAEAADTTNMAETGETLASPVPSSVPFPPPGQGVVPLNYGHVGAAQGDALKKTRSRGLSLSGLAQQQGWNEHDFRRVFSADILEGQHKDDAGYSSGVEHKAQGP